MLCCICAIKVLHVFYVQKMIMFDLFLFGHASLISHRISRIYMLWVHKDKCHATLFPCVCCSFLSRTLWSGSCDQLLQYQWPPSSPF